LFKEVQAEDPAYPEILNYLALAERQIGMQAQYQTATGLLNAGDLPGALVAFQAIEEPYLDASLRIAEIEKELNLQQLLAQAEGAYIGGAWEEAVALFEQVVAEDPDYQTGLVYERLKELYPKAAEAAITGAANKMEGLDLAREYFDRLRRLAPNDPKTREEENRVYGTVSEIMCWTYVQAAQNSLAGQEGSIVALQVAENYFNQALEFCPDDETVTLQRDLADRFLKSQEAYARADWDTVIGELDLVFREDPGYAQGAARQTLYEAYIARGKAESARGVYEAALADFQQAAVIAEQDPSSVQRLFEAQHKVAASQSDLGNYEDAVLLYRSAIDRSGLETRAREDNPDLAALLDQANGYTDARNFRLAAAAYREAVERSTETYLTVTHVVQLGEYLTFLAAKYQTTVTAIAQVNNIPDPNRVIAGQELLIPILPSD
jgi:tetratricopeptide (TPR) repeat protein